MKAFPLRPASLVGVDVSAETFGESVKKGCPNFLFQLLKRNASSRLGAGPGDAAEVQVKAPFERESLVYASSLLTDFRPKFNN